MNAKELFDYYNTSKAHEHLSCSIGVAESFLNIYPQNNPAFPNTFEFLIAKIPVEI